MVLPAVQASQNTDLLSKSFTVVLMVSIIVLVLAIIFLIKNHKKLDK